MPAARRPTRRRTTPNGEGTTTRGYHDVVLTGTFQVRLSRLRATTAAAAETNARGQVEEYARDACQGDNSIEITKVEVKPYKRKVQMELKIDARSVDDARKLLAPLGEKVNITDAYLERERRY